MRHPNTFATIHFADNGQDFLRWDVDKGGRVLASYPYQTDVWAPYTVTNLSDLKPGAKVNISGGGHRGQVAHAVERVETPFNTYARRAPQGR